MPCWAHGLGGLTCDIYAIISIVSAAGPREMGLDDPGATLGCHGGNKHGPHVDPPNTQPDWGKIGSPAKGGVSSIQKPV